LGQWRGGVQNAGPHETAAEVDDGLYVMSVGFQVGIDVSLTQRYAPFRGFTVECSHILLGPGPPLQQHCHVLPVRVDYHLHTHNTHRDG